LENEFYKVINRKSGPNVINSGFKKASECRWAGKNQIMKTHIYRSLLIAAISALPLLAIAQFDDIYFDPDDSEYFTTILSDDTEDRYVVDEYNYDRDDYYYDDDEYDYYDDYDFYYSSRIRRFHRPYMAFDFFDPFYFDPFYYGVNVYIGNPYFGIGSTWNRWNRWNRWNGFDAYDYYWHSRYYNRYLYANNLYLSGWYPYNVWNYCPSYGFGFGFGSLYSGIYGRYNYYGGYGGRSIWGYPYQPAFAYTNPNGYYYGTRRGGSVTSPPPGTYSPRAVRGNVIRTDDIRRSGVVRTAPSPTDQGIRREGTTGTDRNTIRNSPRVTKTYNTPSSVDRNQDRSAYTPRAVTPNRDNSVTSSGVRRSTRTYTPSTSSRRTYTPSGSSSRRSYSPSGTRSTGRSYSPGNSRSSNRSYSPSGSSGRSSVGSGRSSSGSVGRSSSGSSSSSRSSGSSRTSPRG
jgi:hypothetical protein